MFLAICLFLTAMTQNYCKNVFVYFHFLQIDASVNSQTWDDRRYACIPLMASPYPIHRAKARRPYHLIQTPARAVTMNGSNIVLDAFAAGFCFQSADTNGPVSLNMCIRNAHQVASTNDYLYLR